MNKILFGLSLFLIIILLVCFFCCKRVDNFSDLSCENEQKPVYTPQELIFKSQCPNLVILLHHNGSYSVEPVDLGGRPLFTDHSQYKTYYHMGVSPDGEELVPLLEDYELWYYPRYNPIRWFSGPWRYRDRRPFWRRPWRGPWGHRNRPWNRKSGLALQNRRPNRKLSRSPQKIRNTSPKRSPMKKRSTSPRKTVRQGASAKL